MRYILAEAEVWMGYKLRICGDSVVLQETVQSTEQGHCSNDACVPCFLKPRREGLFKEPCSALRSSQLRTRPSPCFQLASKVSRDRVHDDINGQISVHRHLIVIQPLLFRKKPSYCIAFRGLEKHTSIR